MTRKWVKPLLLAATLAVVAVQAQIGHSASAQGENFPQRKAEALQRIDQRIAHLQKQKACVNAANSSETLKTCRPREGNRQRPAP